MKTALTTLSTIAILILSGCTPKQMSFDHEPDTWEYRTYYSTIDTFDQYKIAPRIIVTQPADDSSAYFIRPYIEYYRNYNLLKPYQPDSITLNIEDISLLVNSDTLAIPINDTAINVTNHCLWNSNIVVYIQRLDSVQVMKRPPNYITMLLGVSLKTPSGQEIQGETKEYSIFPFVVDPNLPVAEFIEEPPTPFCPPNYVRYQVNQPSDILITFLDIPKQKWDTLVNQYREPGIYTIYSEDVSSTGNINESGIYLFRMIPPGTSIAKRLYIY